MSSKINYVDLEKASVRDVRAYQRKVDFNVKMFLRMTVNLERCAAQRFSSFDSDSENVELMERISALTGAEIGLIRLINFSDELKSAGLLEGFGCTAIGRNGVIGQTMDLYDVDLSVVREGGALYVTFPPYLTLMGMNNKLAFCTNELKSKTGLGVPVSQVRRSLLRKRSIDEAIDYLEEVKMTNSANFMLSDGNSIVDVEVTAEGCNVYIDRNGAHGRFNAHTNSLIDDGIIEDMSCSRLTKAVDMLNAGSGLGKILDSDGISLPMEEGFGSIVKVVMDVKNRNFMYKDRRMEGYEMLGV